MNWIFEGKVCWKFADHFNSDLITEYPKHKSISDQQGLRSICMIGMDPEFPKKVERGNIMIAGRNFGFGHPHTQAHEAIKAVGISTIVAESFARGWFRTAINLGLPVLPCKGITNTAKIGDKLQVDFKSGKIKNLTSGSTVETEPLPQFMLEIIESGGLVPYLKSRLKNT